MRKQTLTFKIFSLYICDFCNKAYKLKDEAVDCENRHIAQGLFCIKDLDRNIEDLREWFYISKSYRWQKGGVWQR